MILLALAKTERIRGHSSKKTQLRAIIFIRLLPSTILLPRGETLFHFPPINILQIFKDFPSTTRKYSKTSLPAKLSQPQITNNPEIFKDIVACKSVLAANHQQPEIIKDFFACKVVLAAIHQQPENIQRLFRLQKCLGRRSTVSWKYSKTFSPAALS